MKIIWVFKIALAAAFIFFGLQKFTNSPQWINLFAVVGLGQWFRYFTGGLEVVCAVFLLIPRFSSFAAVLLVCTMIGAIFTNLVTLHQSLLKSAFSIACFTLLLIIIFYQRADLFTYAKAFRK